ncbi:Hypothetical protein NGAL_HAMBI2605_38380 [Neorhizobium galegae bv. orientalis]|nr:Hypothetical protein NGAL_HAMBI2605_38380 [Neorhizobium galegae bv. orientalis]
MESPRASGRLATIFVAAVLTAGLLIGAGVLGWNSHSGSCDEGGTYACMTAPDWGNFFAGIFAPIAFIWLVAAVWIQSQELAEQRAELRLTRLEFEENRAVMKEQANEARKQAELIGFQTDILKRQDADRVAAQAQERFVEEIQNLADLINHNLSDVPILEGKNSYGELATPAFQKFPRGKDEAILQFGDFLKLDPSQHGLVGEYSLERLAVVKFKMASKVVDEIIALGNATGVRGSITLERLRISDLGKSLTDLLEITRAFDSRKIAKALMATGGNR